MDAIPSVVIDTDDIEVWPGDSIHYSAQGLFELGIGFFEAWQSLQQARPVIVTETLPGGVAGEPYAAQLEGTGSGGALTWALFPGEKDALPASDPLPDGIVLSPEGSLTGTPTEAGVFSLFVSATDAGGRVRLKTLHLVIAQSTEIREPVLAVAMSSVVRDDTVGANFNNIPPDRGPATDKFFPGQSVNFLSTTDAPGAVETWMQFPVDAGWISEARLRVYILKGAPDVHLTLATAGEQSWNELTLTWESRVTGSPIQSQPADAPGWVEWDVTEYVRSHAGAVAGFALATDVQGEVRIAGKSSPIGAPVLLARTDETASLSTPVITRQPAARTVLVGERPSLEVWAQANPAPDYQWQVSTEEGAVFTDVPGGNSATLALDAAVVEESGNLYRVVISNSEGSVTSDSAALEVLLAPPPVITQQPQSVTSYVNGFVAFTVAAEGHGGLTYQWFRDGEELEDANGVQISFNGLALVDHGSVFHVEVTDELNQTTESVPAVLTIEEAPEEIVLRPDADKSSQSDEAGTNPGLNISGSGPGPEYDRLLAAHAFLRFDASIFNGRVIEEARLKFHFNKNDQSLRIWLVDFDWNESTPGAGLVSLAALDYENPDLLVPVTAGINELDVTSLLPPEVTSASRFTFVLIRDRLDNGLDSIQSRDAALPPELYLRFEMPVTFDRWMAALPEPPPEHLRGMLHDPAGTGIPNLLSYAAGRDPMVADRSLLPVMSMVQEGGQRFLAITHRRRTGGEGDSVNGYVAGGVEYLVQVNNALVTGSWTSGPAVLTEAGDPVAAEEGFEIVTVRSLIPVESAGSEFLRLRVQESAP